MAGACFETHRIDVPDGTELMRDVDATPSEIVMFADAEKGPTHDVDTALLDARGTLVELTEGTLPREDVRWPAELRDPSGNTEPEYSARASAGPGF